MAYMLKEAVYQVRCREPGCRFVSEFLLKAELVGATKADIDREAWMIAKGLGTNQHDAIHAVRHAMFSPDIRKKHSRYETFGSRKG